jgi:signal transduction histidine kinase
MNWVERVEVPRIWLFVLVALTLIAIAVFSDRAVVEWRSTATRLAEQRADASVDLLVTVFNRNMRAVQNSVLAAGLARGVQGSADDVDRIARALASYNYPEVFFAWRRSAGKSPVTFYARAERYPTWLPPRHDPADFPVVSVSQDAVGNRLLERIAMDATVGRQHSVFETDVSGVTYQVISALSYSQRSPEQLDSVYGFMVNLHWTGEHYVRELTDQVTRMAGIPEHDFAVSIDNAPARTPTDGSATAGARIFPLAFFDPRTIAVDWPPDLRRRSIRATAASASDPALLETLAAARRLRFIVWSSLAGLIVAVILTLHRYERLARLRADFVSSVTHELKTPVATISGISEIFASGQPIAPEVSRRHGLLAFHETKRLTRLIDNLLAYTRITDVTEAYNFERLSVHGLIEDALADFHSQLEMAGFTVNVDAPDEIPAIRADRVAMRLVLGNLIDNAIRYSSAIRELNISAHTSARSMIELGVADKGIGIPDDELALITRKFFRGERADRAGTGLGLSIVERIVADHRGTLQFQSKIGEGTAVVVRLPEASS